MLPLSFPLFYSSSFLFNNVQMYAYLCIYLSFYKSSKLPLQRSFSPYRKSWKTPRRRKTASTLQRSFSPYRKSWKTPRRRKTASTLQRSFSPYRKSWKTPRRRKTASTLQRSFSPYRKSWKTPRRRKTASTLQRSFSPYRKSWKTPRRRKTASTLQRSFSPYRKSWKTPRRRKTASTLQRSFHLCVPAPLCVSLFIPNGFHNRFGILTFPTLRLFSLYLTLILSLFFVASYSRGIFSLCNLPCLFSLPLNSISSFNTGYLSQSLLPNIKPFPL